MDTSPDSNIFAGIPPFESNCGVPRNAHPDRAGMTMMPQGALVDYALALQRECRLLDDENKFLTWESRSSIAYFSGAAKLANRLNASSLADIINIAVDELPVFFNCGFAAFFICRADTGRFELARATRGADVLSAYEGEPAFLEKIFASPQDAYLVDFDPKNRCLVFEDGECFDCAVPESWSAAVGARALILPLRAGSRGGEGALPLGGLILGSPEEELEGRDAEAAQFFADVLSNSLHNALLVEKLNRLTIIDSLTGIFNRRHLLDQLGGAVLQAERHGHALCIVMADIDHFKRINDESGHVRGDEVLRGAAGTLKAGIRTGVDLAARYGGEEFMIIMPFTELDAAVEVAERLRRAVRGGEGGITCSFGVARHVAGESVEKFIDRADAALYKAKNNGRDQVAAAED